MTPRPSDRAGSARTAWLAEILPAGATTMDGVRQRPRWRTSQRLRDPRAKVDGQRDRIAGPLRVIDQRPQDGGGRRSAERAEEGPVIIAGLPAPAAVTGGNPCGIVEKVLGFCEHFHTFRHCEEPTGPAFGGPMINSATKQSILTLRGEMDCFAEPVTGRAFARPVGSQ